MQIVSCLELMTYLFIFIQDLKVIIQPPLKNGTHFFWLRKFFKRVQCSEWDYVSVSHEILSDAMVGDKDSNLSVYSRPPAPLRKNNPLAAQLKIAFRRLLFNLWSEWYP